MEKADALTSPDAWTTHTHVWVTRVDHAHLDAVRANHSTLSVEHLILEAVAYADEEAVARGITGNVTISISDDQVSVDDDGRGTDTRFTDDGRIIRKPVMSTQDVRFFGCVDAPLLPDGEPRRGMSVVAALSETLTHENHRTTGSWIQDYSFGVPDEELREIPYRGSTGTLVSFSAGNTASLDLSRMSGLCAGFTDIRVEIHDHRSTLPS